MKKKNKKNRKTVKKNNSGKLYCLYLRCIFWSFLESLIEVRVNIFMYVASLHWLNNYYVLTWLINLYLLYWLFELPPRSVFEANSRFLLQVFCSGHLLLWTCGVNCFKSVLSLFVVECVFHSLCVTTRSWLLCVIVAASSCLTGVHNTIQYKRLFIVHRVKSENMCIVRLLSQFYTGVEFVDHPQNWSGFSQSNLVHMLASASCGAHYASHTIGFTN